MTIEDLKKQNLIVYEYVRGSSLYGTAIEGSDIDIGGVFILPTKYIVGFPNSYIPQVSDEKNDTTYYEIGRWVELLIQSNPNALESLFVPSDKIIGNVHPVIQEILNHRDEFITQECFSKFYGYASTQIYRARGLNKMIFHPMVERKSPLDFCYTAHNQGSIPFTKWLKDVNLKQEFCGLVAIPNMRDFYGVYYDWGMHKKWLEDNNSTEDEKIRLIYNGSNFGAWAEPLNPWFHYENSINKPIGYKGIVKTNEEGEPVSTDIRLSSVEKNIKPIVYLSYNKDGYIKHCKDYKNFKEWETNRNPIRYGENNGKGYDAKNIMHSFRLIHMCQEIARGEGFNVQRTYDRDFLLNVRFHKFSYDYIINKLEEEKTIMEECIKNTKIPETIDKDKIEKLLINIRLKKEND